ncbi:MAG: hypothetical protein CMM61_02555 [Rhodospirillaceae bacterium]|nr:hypothetical protein [Rhodospirillaceae bacterium]
MVPRGETFGAVLRPASVRGVGWDLALAGLIRALLWLAVPVLVLQVFDRALPAARPDELVPLAIAAGVLLALRGLLDLFAGVLAGAPGAAGRQDDVFPPAAMTLAGLPILYAGLAYVAGVLAGAAVLLGLVAALIGYGVQRRAVDASGSYAEKDTIGAGILDAIWTIKAMGAENLVLRRAERAARQDALAARATVRPFAVAAQAETLIDRVTLILTVSLATVLCLNGLITLGQLVAGVLIAGAAVRAAYRGAAGWAATRSAEAAVPSEKPMRLPPLPRLTGNLMIDRVTFEAPADGIRPVARLMFDRVRIEIKVGDTVLITGGDIQMQTAMLRLMAGLEAPGAGRVSADDYDLAAHAPDSIHRQIAYVPPMGDVLPGTLMENLTGFDAGRAADALGAARLTGLDVKAAGLREGFDTRLEGGAAGFPAGFRQHLAITRALAFKPKVLLLDHATENLDSQDLRVFSEVLERLKGRVTIVFASNQPGLRALAERQIDLDDLQPAPEIGAGQDDDAEDGDAAMDDGGNEDDGGDGPQGSV